MGTVQGELKKLVKLDLVRARLLLTPNEYRQRKDKDHFLSRVLEAPKIVDRDLIVVCVPV